MFAPLTQECHFYWFFLNKLSYVEKKRNYKIDIYNDINISTIHNVKTENKQGLRIR